MNRFTSRIARFALLAACAIGCAAEPTTYGLESDQTAAGVWMVGLGSDGEELPNTADLPGSSAEERHLVAPAKSSCPGCGPVPDPWKSIAGPVPDPWQTRPPHAPHDGSGSAGGGGAGGNGNGAP